ncbi:MAG: hypothetical protein PHW35_11875 [Lentimicrobiaceae bacterium]|nr:hypothetical protein [Lentimicrobiaceae bacterium]MDD4598656.1 hypothetical protein [Lentimicrobiaceae bacterium]MDY0026999.1 hypothetical protein [Lentimicrobium sp.]
MPSTFYLICSSNLIPLKTLADGYGDTISRIPGWINGLIVGTL